MKLTSIHTKFPEIQLRIKKNDFIIHRMSSGREIGNLYLSVVQINMPDRPSLPSQNSAPGIILSLFFAAFIIRLFNALPIYFKKVLDMGVYIHA